MIVSLPELDENEWSWISPALAELKNLQKISSCNKLKVWEGTHRAARGIAGAGGSANK